MLTDTPENGADPFDFKKGLELTFPVLRTFNDKCDRDVDISSVSEKEDVHGMTLQIRSALERYATSPDLMLCSPTRMTELYGINRYYCPRTACFYFHHGFADAARRDRHCYRHDRPFRCNDSSCFGASAGFTTEKQLKKHNERYHADASVLKWEFPEWKDPKQLERNRAGQGSLACPKCQKCFTRAHNLRVHMRIHQGDKPFSCAECGKAFARDPDRRRHESSHNSNQNIICGGDLVIGQSWGCGKSFARLDALSKHFRSETGQKCLREKEESATERVSETSLRQEDDEVSIELAQLQHPKRTLEQELMAKHWEGLKLGNRYPGKLVQHSDKELPDDYKMPLIAAEASPKKRKLVSIQDEEQPEQSHPQGNEGSVSTETESLA
ncbi:MAG: hypothetical protein Q9227_004240 [Pyrenula ochraceoflavens]